tara:strand:+ start:555 stop:1493 length:939 start_codon:yes stop_codon:yes gene_type:complete
MKFADISTAVLIIIIFCGLYFSSMLSVGLKKLKEEWPKYRCVPTMMPFAGYLGHDTFQNFTYCVGNIQFSLMHYFMEPIQYILANLTNISSWIIERVQFIRLFIHKLRILVRKVIEDIYGMIVNVLIQFQKLIIKTKDTVWKLISIVVIQVFMIEGAMMTGKSIDAGPIGDTLRFLCFSPNTSLILKKGSKIKMQDIHLGDVLENGAEVIGKLNLKGSPQNPYYKIWSNTLNEFIYVTGSHKIFNERFEGTWREKKIKESEGTFNLKNYVEVKNHWNAIKTSLYDKELSCLITSNHNIPIGEYTFWDWEDED